MAGPLGGKGFSNRALSNFFVCLDLNIYIFLEYFHLGLEIYHTLLY